MYFFFFNDTATTEIYTLSLHDALPIYLSHDEVQQRHREIAEAFGNQPDRVVRAVKETRSEEHTSELQSQSNLVCRLLLEKKKKPQSVSRITTTTWTSRSTTAVTWTGRV